jgi:hypothetical protein
MISEEQLQIWASAPDPAEMSKIKYTHEEVRNALKKYLPTDEIKKKYGLSSFDYKVYLQGSYANSTNISYDSDVDVVIELKSTFSRNISKLSFPEQQEYHKHYSPSSYAFNNFKQDVYNALIAYFGNDVEYAKKCLKIPGNTGRVNADVVPCFEYRDYERFLSYSQQKYRPGIKFYNTDTDEVIINYPEQHKTNCEAKNKDTEGNFKSIVRVFKNFKRELVSGGVIDEKTAPSYFIENMIYNCTPHCFNGNYSEMVLQVLQFLSNDLKSGRIASYVCANEKDMLFGNKTWAVESATLFITNAATLFLQEK